MQEDQHRFRIQFMIAFLSASLLVPGSVGAQRVLDLNKEEDQAAAGLFEIPPKDFTTVQRVSLLFKHLWRDLDGLRPGLSKLGRLGWTVSREIRNQLEDLAVEADALLLEKQLDDAPHPYEERLAYLAWRGERFAELFHELLRIAAEVGVTRAEVESYLETKSIDGTRMWMSTGGEAELALEQQMFAERLDELRRDGFKR